MAAHYGYIIHSCIFVLFVMVAAHLAVFMLLIYVVVGRPWQVSTLSHVGGVAPSLLPTPFYSTACVEVVTWLRAIIGASC